MMTWAGADLLAPYRRGVCGYRADDRLRAWRRRQPLTLRWGGHVHRPAWQIELRCPDCDNHYTVMAGLEAEAKRFPCSICSGLRWNQPAAQEEAA